MIFGRFSVSNVALQVAIHCLADRPGLEYGGLGEALNQHLSVVPFLPQFVLLWDVVRNASKLSLVTD
jgi:hypothetical protein